LKNERRGRVIRLITVDTSATPSSLSHPKSRKSVLWWWEEAAAEEEEEEATEEAAL
jgi:hypothetical protein